MLGRLLVRDFRCLAHAELEPHPRLSLFVGRNAQGKTSLLEAICVLMRLQSPRTGARGEWLRFGCDSCLVEGMWNGRSLRYTQTRTARRLAVEGATCARSGDYLAATALVVWMDHADMNLARGGAEHRRRHLDFAAAQMFPDYLPALRQYDRALRARNFLLKRDAAISWRQVDAYGVLLEKNAVVLRAGRGELVRRMRPWVAEAQRCLSGSREAAEVEYAPGYEGESLQAVLIASREEESRTRATVAGPHRDELRLTVDGRPAGAFASDGQQRSLSLAMKLAQARVLAEERGAPPLLLMDDVFGELDPGRRRAVLESLPEGSQALVTTTDLDWMEAREFGAGVFEVDGGRVREGAGG